MATFKRMHLQLPRPLLGVPKVSSSSGDFCRDMAKYKGWGQLGIYVAYKEKPKPFQLSSLLLGVREVHNLLTEEKDALLILPRG